MIILPEYCFDSCLSVVPALIGAGATLLGTVLANGMSRNNAQSAFNQEKDYSRWLLRNQTQEKVRDLRSAGLNPAFMNGSQLGATPAVPNMESPAVTNPFDLSSAMMFGKLSADTRLTNSEARAQELENADKEAKNKVLGSSTEFVAVDSDGVPITDFAKWDSEHVGELPEFVSILREGKDGSFGRFDAEQILKRWTGETKEINVSMFENQLKELVLQGQISNPQVVDALQNMPYKQYVKLLGDIRNATTENNNMIKQGSILDIEKVTRQLEQDIMKDSNIYQYIDKAFEGDFSIKDFVKVLVKAFIGSVSRVSVRGSF